MTLRTWRESEDLRAGEAWLLEASAGTGKTYQIAGLVLRLVGEYDVPIDRILAITFTNAATAELRDRIRTRLSSALVALEDDLPPSADAFLEHFRSLQHPSRETLKVRIRRALRDFDLAAISTIHGFAQRMLVEFAFETGQDPDLELLSDPREILQQLIHDEISLRFQNATADQVAVYKAAGFTYNNLMAVAKAMCGAVEPEVIPGGSPVPTVETDAGHRLTADFATQLERVRKGFESSREVLLRAESHFKSANDLQNLVDNVSDWLRKGAPWPYKERPAIEAIRGPVLWEARNIPRGASGTAIDDAPFWETLHELDRFVNKAKEFWKGSSLLADFARVVRKRYDEELHRRRVLTFDAMLSRLAEGVRTGGGADSPTARRIRDRYDAVLVDEFQDTDAAQWTVLEAAFLGHKRLILIGDPKQAIYAFRGADVHVYTLAAAKIAESNRRTMKVNHRSDKGVLQALNTLWREGSGAFEDVGFDYVGLSVPDAKKGTSGAPESEPRLSVRWLDKRTFAGDAPVNHGKPVSKKKELEAAKLTAAEIVSSLARAGEGALPRASKASDFAVLVAKHKQAALVLRTLRDAGVPAVGATRKSVFTTDAAGWVATWLAAVAARGRDREARAAAVTPLFGWTADSLAWAIAIADRGEEAREESRRCSWTPPGGNDTDPWQKWTARLHDAATKWRRWGFARVFDREAIELAVLPRVLAMPGGERHATDLRHLFELLHAEERATRADPATLAAWIGTQADVSDDSVNQRLESDEQAVRVETIHVSKGLQYANVLLPFTWDVPTIKTTQEPIVLRNGETIRVDLSPKDSDARSAARDHAAKERRREDLRKLYVALTRAKHHNTVWYGPIGDKGAAASASPMGRLLLRDPASKGYDDAAMPHFKKDQEESWRVAQERLDKLSSDSDGTIGWSAVGRLPARDFWRPKESEQLPVAELARWDKDRPSLRGRWRLTSYSGLSGRSGVSARMDTAPPDADDEQNVTTEDELERDDLRAGRDERPSVAASASTPSLLEVSMPRDDRDRLKRGGGTVYGTFVHEVFEAIDFTSAQGRDGRALRDLIGACAERNGLQADPQVAAELVEKMPGLLTTPLDHQGGTLADPLRGLPKGFTLAHIDARDRLDELAFNLRLGAGARYTRTAAPTTARTGTLVIDPSRIQTALAAALDDARVPPQEIAPVRAWLSYHLERARLEGVQIFEEIAGILTGSIDLVFRAHPDAVQRAAGDTDPRWFVVDYKTNVIETSTPGHFTGPWLAWKMATTGYPLQALLYTVALHRHLQLRLRGYDYDRHMGGYLYLFVRGMAGADTPRCAETGRCLGVFAHRWRRETIEAVDDALGAAFGAALGGEGA